MGKEGRLPNYRSIFISLSTCKALFLFTVQSIVMFGLASIHNLSISIFEISII